MSAPQIDTPRSAAANDGPIQYRAVSGLAVLALALGIASAAAMVGPVLWFVPIVAAIVALVAMRRIRASEDLVGWNIAFLGLLLAILFGIAASARTISRQYWLDTRAEQFSDCFFEFLQQNKPHAAHQLRERPGVRKPLTDTLSKAYESDPESQKSFEKFVADEPVKTLLEAGKQAEVERIATELLGRDDRSDHIAVRYEITPGAGRKTLQVITAVKRNLDSTTGRETWQIENVSVE
jgi:hypothetical protein